jgi:hypothetical protein
MAPSTIIWISHSRTYLYVISNLQTKIMDKQGKWEFLRPVLKEMLEREPGLPLVEAAKQIKKVYALNIETEAVRKILSRLVNLGGDMDLPRQEREIFPQQKINIYTTTKPKANIYTPDRKVVQYDIIDKPVLHTTINKPGNYLVLGCWHVPFHNRELTKRVLDLMDTHEFAGIILNGDFLDCNTLSSYARGKFSAVPGLTLNKEYAEGKTVLKQMLELLPKDAAKVYMYGNHEDRYHRFVADMQNAKTPPPSPTEGLGLYDLGFQVVESYDSGYITLGAHLDILHGIYYNTHCAKTHIDRFRGSVLFAHTHRIQSYIEGRTGGFNIGWGGDVNSPAFGYADRGTKASWQNGFAVETIDEQGNYHHQQVIAMNSRFVYGGKQY